MSTKTKQAKAHDFSPKARLEITERDHNECIFCKIGYHTKEATWFGKEIKSIMHYIPRSKGGLGIPQNGAVGCQYHHELMDNGNKGLRPEMLEIFREDASMQYREKNTDQRIRTRLNAWSCMNADMIDAERTAEMNALDIKSGKTGKEKERAEKMKCENMQKDPLGIRCKATGYLCRYIPADPRNRYGSCGFAPMYLKSKKMQQMIAQIRAVKPGSAVTVIFRRSHGWYTREVIDSSQGEVLSIDDYGTMEVKVKSLRGSWKYRPEDLTRTVFLNNRELERNIEKIQEELEEQDRINRERRENDGRDNEGIE